MRTKGLLLLIAALSACAAAGGLKPTIYTAPPSYLDTFPLGTVSETEMVSKVGPPDRTTEIGGKKAFVYELGEGYGKRTFTYTFDRNVVIDVLYNDSGPYNGITAKSRQGR
jgi:hypothetical protein